MRRAGCAIHGGVKRAGALALTAALLLGVAPAAFAKPHHTTPTNTNDPFKVDKPAAAAQPDDGLGTRDVYVEADNMVDDRTNSLVTGEGHVEVRYQGRTLRADKVIYNSTTGATHAYGHIVIVEADGTVSYATEMEMDDQFRAGVALGFSARLQDNVTIVANAAIHRNESVNVLRDARYTPCDICRKDGSGKEPTFSIQAEQITQDHDHGVVYYRHAIIRVKGVPIMALPFFWHADPTIDRRSGLLTPKIQYSKRRGLSYEQPYLFALSPSSELIVDPQLNTAVNPLLNMRYRQQFYSGLLDVRGGYTYGKLFDSHGDFGDSTNRSYILAKGSWQIDPRVTIGFGAEQVTDPTFFARYGVRQIFQDRGPFKTDTDRLVSQLYVQRQDSQSYFSVAALDYESIRASISDITTGGVTRHIVQRSDTNSAFPFVGPMIEARYNPRDLILGGRLNVLASAVVLNRSNTVIAVADPSGINPAGPQPYVVPAVAGTAPALGHPAQSLTYKDSARATAEADWRTDITFANGIRVSPFLEGRGDAYAIGSGMLSSGLNYTTLNKADNTVTRATGTLGFDASWPFFKPVGKGSIVLEPLVQAAVSPNVKLNANIPNEDSASFEFDETNLFSTHRFPGYDLYEGGARINVGGRATADFGGGRSASLLIGRVFRNQPDLVFSAVSGLQGKSSDWITAVTITPIPGLSFFNRARSDADSWKVHREEAGVNLSIGRSSLSLRYRYDENGVSQIQCVTATCISPYGGMVTNGSTVVGKVQSAELNGSTYITKHWGVLANLNRDLQTRIWPMAQVGVFYQDECVRLDLLYTHDETYSTVIGSSDAVTFRLTLTTLGTSLTPGTKAFDGR